MSAVLRHRANEFNIPMNRACFVGINDIARLHAFQGKCRSAAMLDWVVMYNPKARFEFMVEDPGVEDTDPSSDRVPYTISLRATQGHSGETGSQIDPNLAMTPMTVGMADCPSYCAHGTRLHLINEILAEGLLPGGRIQDRTYTHCTAIPPSSGRITGLRLN